MIHIKKASYLYTLLTLQSVYASDFNNTVFFGDSLTDSGTFLEILQSDPTYTGEGKFTTNPGNVWSEFLANEYNLNLSPSNQGGTNYAESGARITGTPGVGAFPASGATPVLSQVMSYLATNGGKADSNTLYSLWGGANDIIWIASGGVVPANIQAYLSDTITGQVQAIGALKAAGAKYIIVPTLPDIGASPFGISQGVSGAAFLTQLSVAYNQNLMVALQLNNISVITADTFSLLREVQSQPNTYGFDNVSSPVCGAISSLLCVTGTDFPEGLEQTYLFADGVHPTTGGHQIISDYVKSILDAPVFAGKVASLAINEQRLVINEIEAQLNVSRQQATDATALWISGEAGQQTESFDGSPLRLGIGLTKRLSDTRSFGAALHLSKNNTDVSGGKIEESTTSFSVYSGWDMNNWQLNTSLSISSGEFDTTRDVTLGPTVRRIQGSTDGLQFGAQAKLNYLFTSNNLKHGPSVGVRLQRLNITGFTESAESGNSTAMHFNHQTLNETTAVIGWQVRGKDMQWQPYANINWEHRLSNDNDPIKVSLLNLPNNVFSAPVDQPDESYASLTMGMEHQINNNLSLGGRFVHLMANDDMSDTRLNITAKSNF